MPKPTTFRKISFGKRVSSPLSAMPAGFQTVINAWDLTAASAIMAVVAHPRTTWEQWDYTLTFEMIVGTTSLRGHVHFTARGGMAGYDAGPGSFWISGIPRCDGSTPTELVDRYKAVDVIAEANKSKLALTAITPSSSSSSSSSPPPPPPPPPSSSSSSSSSTTVVTTGP